MPAPLEAFRAHGKVLVSCSPAFEQVGVNVPVRIVALLTAGQGDMAQLEIIGAPKDNAAFLYLHDPFTVAAAPICELAAL